MELRVSVGNGYINVKEVSLSDDELIAEIEKRLEAKGIEIRDGKTVRWIANPYYDDFAEHSHESPGHYEQVTNDPEKLKLLRAAKLVCAALKNKTTIK